MKHLDRYTPDICARLREIAEDRHWRSWRNPELHQEDIAEEIELTYHLHLAAEVSGQRAGMPSMSPCPIRVPQGEEPPDPAEFVECYRVRHVPRNKRPNDENRKAS